MPPPLVEEVTRPGGSRGLRYNFHRGQRRAWASDRRVVAVIAGSRGGKTSFGAAWLHREMCRCGPGDYLLVAPSYQLLEKAAAPEVEHLLGRTLRLGQLKRSPFRFDFSDEGCVALWGKAPERRPRVLCGHADDPDSLEAMTLRAAWLDECGQTRFRLGSWEAVQRRLSIDRGRCLLTTTPYNLGWLKQVIYDPWRAAQGRHPYIDVVTFDSTENPAFPREEWERAEATMPRWRFDMFFRGRFTRPAGQIYDCFDSEKHVCPRFAVPKDWPRHVGIDFGNVNTAAVFLAEEPGTGRLYAYREYWPREGRTVAEHVAALLEGEPGLPNAVGGSHQEEGWREAFAATSLPVSEPDITGGDSVEVGIAALYALIKGGRLRVFADLAGVLDQLQSYSRELDDLGQPTEKIDGKASYHFCDALRYAAAYLTAPQPDYNVHTFNLTPVREDPMSFPIRYPQVRHFPQTNSIQPQPVIRGTQLLGAPGFPSQEEAAFFVLECFRLCGLPAPAFTVPELADRDDLAPDERGRRQKARENVTALAAKFLKDKRVGPEEAPAPQPEPAAAPAAKHRAKAEHPQPANK